MKGVRTNIDFGNHELMIIESKEVTIYKFKKPETNIHSVTLVNHDGVMAVKGDFGNYIFNREFHPCANTQGIGENYYIEKLECHSVQKGTEFDPDSTVRLLNERLAEIYQIESEEIDYLKKCVKEAEDKHQLSYDAYAYLNMPSGYDNEYVIRESKLNSFIPALFDAMECMCEYLREKTHIEGEKVTYTRFGTNHTEKGIIKKIHPDGDKAWVVYNCNGIWEDYENYTAALSCYDSLTKGWE